MQVASDILSCTQKFEHPKLLNVHLLTPGGASTFEKNWALNVILVENVSLCRHILLFHERSSLSDVIIVEYVSHCKHIFLHLVCFIRNAVHGRTLHSPKT